MRRRAGRPVLGGEVDTPKMRTWREKFPSDSRAFFRSVAKINHSTLLFFLGYGIDQHQVCAKRKFRLDVEQASVGIDHDCLAVLSEFTAVDALARRSHRYASENARTTALLTAALLVGLCFAHVCLVSCMANDPESTITPSKVPKNTG